MFDHVWRPPGFTGSQKSLVTNNSSTRGKKEGSEREEGAIKEPESDAAPALNKAGAPGWAVQCDSWLGKPLSAPKLTVSRNLKSIWRALFPALSPLDGATRDWRLGPGHSEIKP